MPSARLASVELVARPGPLDPLAGECGIEVKLEDGRSSSFTAASFDRPAAWVKAGKSGHWFSTPALYVRRLDREAVAEATAAMAADMGGFWLRYYNSRAGAPAAARVGLGAARMTQVSDPARLDRSCGVVEAVLKDGREFSILAASPAWFRAELERLGLRFYFGPSVLFLAALDDAHARKAARAMSAADEQLFCRYDTPRRTLPEILAAFKAAHP